MTTATVPRPAAAPRPVSSTLPAWGLLCFFLSGAAGLLYEVAWSKQLAYLLGSSLHSVATVVAAFLGGLALGARLLGVPLARRRDGARVYAALELGVAVLGVATLPILRALHPVVGEMYRGLGGESAGFALARLGLLIAVLLPPAALMGATLPVLVGHFERDLVGAALARLYAINTLGAVAGSVGAGFVLMPTLGLTGTTVVAASLNLLVAALAFRAGGAARAGAESPAPRVESAAPAASGGGRAGFALLFGLSGFAALAFQIAWVRVFSLVFGSSVYSFAAVLGVYLLGLALGSAAVAPFIHRLDTPAAFGRLQIAIAAITLPIVFAFAKLPEWVLQLGARSGTNWAGLLAGEVMLTAALILLPCALLGAVFPVATRILQRRDGGHAAGFAYAVNTAGTIAGSLVAGFYAVPTWGVQGTHLSAALLCLGIGLAALAIAAARREATGGDLLFAGVGVIVVGGLAAVAPRWDPALMNSGPFRPSQASNLEFIASIGASFGGGAGPTVWRATRLDRVLYYREGINGAVLVATDPESRARWVRVGGKVDASTGDMATQVLLGLIPAAMADSGARSAVIGLGSGYTTASALAGGAGPTETIELEQSVVDASRFFHSAAEHPLADPRSKLILGDARTHLAYGGGRYDLIVSQPSNPWIAGQNNLFTVDFYREVKSRLEPDGVFCQWIQLYELSPQSFGSLAASFLAVFPEGQVFCDWPNVDLILVAAPPGRRLDLDRLRTPAARRMLDIARVRAPEDLAAYYAGSLADLRAAAAGAPLNRDDRPFVEYRAPRDLVTIGRSSAGGDPAVIGKIPFASGPPADGLFGEWPMATWYEARVRALLRMGEVQGPAATTQAARSIDPALADRLERLMARGRLRMQSNQELEQARHLIGTNRRDEGLQVLTRSVVTDSLNGEAWVTVARESRRENRMQQAEDALTYARREDDPRVMTEAALEQGMFEMARSRPREAADAFAEALRWDRWLGKGWLLESRARRQAGDVDGARTTLERGLEQLPGDPLLIAERDVLAGSKP